MSDDIAIQVRDVKKSFVLPNHRNDSIKQGIVKIFEKKDKSSNVFHALRGISFDIKKGEFFGILGRNGSGKSTLLKIISEIYQPTHGAVKHKGTLVSFIELGVGFKADLSGKDNVYLNGAMLGFSKTEIDERYDDIVKFAELENFMDQKIKNYSSGMKVRLAFAVAIQAKSDILVLDEVLAVGDASFQRKCYEYFKSLKESKDKTIVFVTHSMGAVKDYCDKAILIEDGKIIHEGAAEDVANHYLKLFNDSKYDAGNNDRFGDGRVRVEKIEAINKGEKVVLDIAVASEELNTEDVVIGIDIHDHKSRLVGGVESYNTKGGKKFAVRAKQQKHVQFEIDNIFGTGDFFVTISVKQEGGIATYDFWSRAAKFTNVNSQDYDSYFPVVLPSRFKVNE